MKGQGEFLDIVYKPDEDDLDCDYVKGRRWSLIILDLVNWSDFLFVLSLRIDMYSTVTTVLACSRSA
jgi:hypothetical protein